MSLQPSLPSMPTSSDPARAGAPPEVPGGGTPAQQAPPALGFLRQPWVQTILPFVTSLTVHAAIVVLAVAALKLATTFVPPLLNTEQTVVPDASLPDDHRPGGIPNLSSGNAPLMPAIQDDTPEGGKPGGWASKDGLRIDPQSGGPSEADASPSLIGLGMNGIARGGPGSGTSDGSGPLAQWGAGLGGGAIGPHGIVFGHGGNAHKIVFVCDATGSMLNKMASLKNELQKAVTDLKAVQSFDVIFFHDETFVALNMDQLEPATADIKRKTFRFLDDVTAVGKTNPLPGIEAAFRLQPDLIYLLSDAADFPDNKAVLDLCRRMNPGHKTKVNTILFYENQTEADQNRDSEDLMVDIAKEAGGTFKHVIMTELE